VDLVRTALCGGASQLPSSRIPRGPRRQPPRFLRARPDGAHAVAQVDGGYWSSGRPLVEFCDWRGSRTEREVPAGAKGGSPSGKARASRLSPGGSARC
jgi:hypothetical protein